MSQKLATEKVFLKKKIPFMSFEVIKRDENTIGELFCFFVLETITSGTILFEKLFHVSYILGTLSSQSHRLA